MGRLAVLVQQRYCRRGRCVCRSEQGGFSQPSLGHRWGVATEAEDRMQELAMGNLIGLRGGLGSTLATSQCLLTHVHTHIDQAVRNMPIAPSKESHEA